jgi:flagellar basal-body rod modification protein FlgD
MTSSSVTSQLANAYATAASSAASGSSSSATSSSRAAGATDPLANESTFLQLLVSQLKNQNPMNPMDGTTFVTQLAQFSDLEQSLAMRNDLDSINSKYTGSAAATTSAGSSSNATQSGGSTTTTQGTTN